MLTMPFLRRLKVVGLPDGYGEDQLRNLFALAGQVVEARVVHDKASGRAVGYGYVSFGSKEAADRAISTFDDQLQLPGAANNLSVYYAKKQHDQLQDRESCPARNAKLYFCGTPSGFRRDSILALFSAFGRVRHLQVYTDSFGVLSSGTVTMYSTEEATAAMTNLDGKVLQSGTAPLKVTWAQLSTLPRRNPAGGGPPPPMPKGFTVSYACIPITVTPSEIAALFGRFGMVLQVVPFAHRREGPRGSRGCGLVVMEAEQGALDAIDTLSGKYTWAGAERPLQVQAFYGAERSGPHQLPSLPEGGYSNGGGGYSNGGGAHGVPGRNRYQPASRGVGPRANSGVVPADDEPAPPGCAPDAFKLVLVNLPNSYSQADVQALLQPYGTVVSVFRQQGTDPTGDGTATVWYVNGAQAEAALNALRNTVLVAQNGTRQLTVLAGPPQRNSLMRKSPIAAGAGSYIISASTGAGVFEPGSTTNGSMMPQVVYQQQSQQPIVIYQPSTPYQDGGVSVIAGPGSDSVLPQWQGQPQVTAVGGVQVLAAPNGPVANGNGAFDMQQLMYVLPQTSVAQTVVVSSAAPAPASACSGQLWSSPGPLQNQLGGTGVTNSSSILEQMQAVSAASTMTNFMANGGPPGVNMPVSSAQPGAAFSGWW
eukprot:GHUV01005159.1.p1 GENE.GHUV01005159.1~~GHUV01005159.1.p1  ORF type:complete len:650 (+),score=223.81 GHUV01005159.1:737-2686(+)